MPTSLLEPIPADLDFSRVTAVYADGGVKLKNPSPHGGTWAFCYVNAIGARLWGTGGIVTPTEIGRPWVSNNLTEVLALLLAFEQLPDGWSGAAFTDSQVALGTHTMSRKNPDFLPADLFKRLVAARERLGVIRWTLLGGHPNRKELAAGVRKDGKPVSIHNVWCDERCGEQALLVPLVISPAVAGGVA